MAGPTGAAAPSPPATARPSLGWAPAWVITFVALWPARGVAEGVLILGALAGLGVLVRNRFRGGTGLLSGPAWALTCVLFAAYWLPEAISALDAVDARRAALSVLTDLLYLPVLWIVASAAASEPRRQRTFTGLAIIALAWTADALVEAVLGTSPLFWLLDHARQALGGTPMCPAPQAALADRLGGALGLCNLKLGIVLASLSPFALDWAGRRGGPVAWMAAAVAIGTVVLLAGSRASWLTYGLVLAFSGWRMIGWRKLALLFAAGAIGLGLATLLSANVQQRMQRSAQALAASEAGMDAALSGRGRIWSAAWCMTREHPVNGVGARGFRTAFPGCDPQPGVIAAWGTGVALHAHQIVLEIISETGLIGLILWLAGAAQAWRAWRFAPMPARDRARPAMLALAVSVFPLNTHLAVYSTFWGSAVLMLMALYVGSLLGREGE